MKGDPELIRLLLLAIEANDVSGMRGREIQIGGYKDREVMSHLNMLGDAGFIVGEFSRSSTNPERIIATEVVFDLSWKGHEYLDLVRDEKVWKETKRISSEAGAFSIEFLKKVATRVAMKAIETQGIAI